MPRSRSGQLRDLDTLESLTAYLIDRDEARRDLLWEAADTVAAWIDAHRDGGPVTPLYRAIAHATGWSSRFVRDLARTARAFPPDVRAAFADKSWQWFAECLREGDPLEAAQRYASLSVREIRDYRRSRRQAPPAPGYMTVSITLRPDQVEELEASGRVTVSAVLPDGHAASVSIARGERAVEGEPPPPRPAGA
jgi:hypothetical protein